MQDYDILLSHDIHIIEVKNVQSEDPARDKELKCLSSFVSSTEFLQLLSCSANRLSRKYKMQSKFQAEWQLLNPVSICLTVINTNLAH